MPPSSGSGAATARPRVIAVLATVSVLILIVLAFAVMRVIVDGPNIAAGTVPPEGLARP